MTYVFMKKAIRICKEMPTLSPAHDNVSTMPTACKCLWSEILKYLKDFSIN
jgi:hypothetical protein